MITMKDILEWEEATKKSDELLYNVQHWFTENPDKAKPSIGYGKEVVHTPVKV